MHTGTVTVAGRTASWAFTDRTDGASTGAYAWRNLAGHVGDDPIAVRTNREALEHELGLGSLSWMGPVHGIDIAELTQHTSITPNVDALATTATSVPLTTLGADCVPMLVAAGPVIVAAHVGWRGLVAGMAERVAALLSAHGVPAAQAKVLLGPAICGSCYGIPDDRADAIAEACPAALREAANGGPGADIRAGLAATWQQWGALVEWVGPCTFESPQHFSHRRDGVTGRQAGVIAWMP